MADDRQQVRQRRVRRSRRQGDQATVAPSDGQAYDDSRQRLAEIDDIIDDMVTPTDAADSVVLGDQDAQSVRPLTSEEVVTSFRQQGGQ
jgi:hypothetical protein